MAAPKRNACLLVTQQDAESILGPKAVQHSGPGSCAWDIPGQKLFFVVIVDASPNVATQIQLPRQAVPKAGGTVMNEAGVAPSAYSTKLRQAQSVYFLKGGTAVSISIVNNAGTVPESLDKLRVIAKRILTKIYSPAHGCFSSIDSRA